jgi:hypothetical protein
MEITSKFIPQIVMRNTKFKILITVKGQPADRKNLVYLYSMKYVGEIIV